MSDRKACLTIPVDSHLSKQWVGTVHTMQGKEADVVVLVLGTNPDQISARRWAAARPNLLNVAVSRARRRLYVVGNRKSWESLNYFSTLAASLPPWPSRVDR